MAKFDDDVVTEKKLKSINFRDWLGPIKKIQVMEAKDPYDFYIELFGNQGRAVNTTIGNTEYQFNFEWANHIRSLINRFPKVSKKLRNYVIAAREDGVKWRGEEFNHFTKIFTETQNYSALTSLAKRSIELKLRIYRGVSYEKFNKVTG